MLGDFTNLLKSSPVKQLSSLECPLLLETIADQFQKFLGSVWSICGLAMPDQRSVSARACDSKI